MKKIRFSAGILALLMLLSAVPFAAAAGTSEMTVGTEEANALHELGLLAGVGKFPDGSVDFDLGGSLTRAQSYTLVVRFLGAEAEAKAQIHTHPFADLPDWAVPYIGYAYANGITQGVSATAFNPDGKMTEAAFLTVILRVLGYQDRNDGSGDFVWSDPYTLAAKVGLLKNTAKDADFVRGDAFVICYRALTATVKSGATVAEQLIAKGLFTKAKLDAVCKTAEPVTELLAIGQLNLDGENGDHADDDYNRASLEINYRESVRLSSETVKGAKRYDKAWYPRVKKVRDDLYVLFCMPGQYGPHLYYATSTDGISWNNPQVLYNASKNKFTHTDGPLAGTEDAYYAVNADACVLENGQILVVYAVRANHGYTYPEYSDLCGLYMRRGVVNKSGTITWGAQTRIYTGQCWEPFIMQRANGTVEVYFSQIAPYITLYGFDREHRSSGTGYIASTDNGFSWTPDLKPGNKDLYRAKTVYQEYIGDRNGVPYFTGQMPVATELYNGRILLAVERKSLEGVFTVGYALSGENGEWKALELTEEGKGTPLPEARAAAPYVARFLSGETYITYGVSSVLTGRLGAPDGSAFGRTFTAVPDAKGSWGSATVIGTHSVISAQTNTVSDTLREVCLTRAYLNHRVNAPKTTITVDGFTNDWAGNTDALFVGSETQAQVTLRTAHDDENLYFLISRLDEDLTDSDDVTVSIAAGEKNNYRITVSLDGKISIEYYEGLLRKNRINGGEAAVKILGTLNDASDTDEGAVIELAIPKVLVQAANAESIAVHLALRNKDGKSAVKSDTFTDVSISDSVYWPIIVLDK